MSKYSQRKILRLKEYDYSKAGAYFVTICTQDRENLLGEISQGQMAVNNGGQAVQKIWQDLPLRFPEIKTDAFVIMPNHVHGIIMVGAQFIAPLKGSIKRAPTLGEIVRVFKAISTRRIRANYHCSFRWQRNYYEHIICDEISLNRIREYIHTNHTRWELDRENPLSKGKDDFDIWLENCTRGTSPLTLPDALLNLNISKENLPKY
jgi:putative transposase